MNDSAKTIFVLPAFPSARCTGLVSVAVAFAMNVAANPGVFGG